MGTADYMQWLDWNPCILRTIFELGNETKMHIEKVNAVSSETTVGEYLIASGIAEMDQNSIVKLTEFGRKIYSKLLELNYIFEQGIEDVA